MSEMVERVKIALRTFRSATTEIQARAAIEAMREPTQEMLESVMRDNSVDEDADIVNWRSMISAALK